MSRAKAAAPTAPTAPTVRVKLTAKQLERRREELGETRRNRAATLAQVAEMFAEVRDMKACAATLAAREEHLVETLVSGHEEQPAQLELDAAPVADRDTKPEKKPRTPKATPGTAVMLRMPLADWDACTDAKRARLTNGPHGGLALDWRVVGAHLVAGPVQYGAIRQLKSVAARMCVRITAEPILPAGVSDAAE